MLRINGAPGCFYLQDYTGMHGQQNIKLNKAASSLGSLPVSLWFLASVQKFFKKSRHHLQILGARRVTGNKFLTESPQFQCDL
jgi:hypothetical protein